MKSTCSTIREQVPFLFDFLSSVIFNELALTLGEGTGGPLQCSCLENPMDGGAWWAAVYRVAQSWTRLKWLHFHFSLSCIGEGNGNPLQCFCRKNPRDGEPGGLLSMGLQKVWHDWSNLPAAAAITQLWKFKPSTSLHMSCSGTSVVSDSLQPHGL